jgi:hypothetical protein
MKSQYIVHLTIDGRGSEKWGRNLEDAKRIAGLSTDASHVTVIKYPCFPSRCCSKVISSTFETYKEFRDGFVEA